MRLQLVARAAVATVALAVLLTVARRGEALPAAVGPQDPAEVAVVVTDPSPTPPVKRDLADAAECGRGLVLVEALSARWGWKPQHPGKTVYAIFTMGV